MRNLFKGLSISKVVMIAFLLVIAVICRVMEWTVPPEYVGGVMFAIMLNPFEQDAFNMVSLTQSINILPNRYGRVGQLGLFTDKGVRLRTIIVEEQNGVLNLLPTLPLGAPGTQNKLGKRIARTFKVPHIPMDDVILPSEYEGIRAFGSEDTLKALAGVMNDHLQAARTKFDITLEYLRMGALKGIILDADGDTLYNLYTEFEISPETQDFDLDSTSPLVNVAAKCRAVVRFIEDHLFGEVMTGVRCLCDATFFDALISHPNVEKFYLNWQGAAQLAGVDPRKGFSFAGITFEEYRGVATDKDGNSRVFIASGEGHCYPEGTQQSFNTIYAPADFIETEGTTGIPLYSKQEPRKFNRGIDLHIQSNPLPICYRPGILVKVTKT